MEPQLLKWFYFHNHNSTDELLIDHKPNHSGGRILNNAIGKKHMRPNTFSFSKFIKIKYQSFLFLKYFYECIYIFWKYLYFYFE